MAGRSSSSTRTQPDQVTQPTWTIPVIFCSQQADLQTSTQASSHAAAASQISLPSVPDHGGLPNTANYVPQPPSFLSITDLQAVAMDIKSTLTAAISDLKADLRAVVSRLETVESVAMTHRAAIQQVQQVFDTHAQHLIEMHRHIEDLDNRGRRRNL